jgi:hypothetical protein
MNTYIHGYSEQELKRLQDQAHTLDELLHYDSIFPESRTFIKSCTSIAKFETSVTERWYDNGD